MRAPSGRKDSAELRNLRRLVASLRVACRFQEKNLREVRPWRADQRPYPELPRAVRRPSEAERNRRHHRAGRAVRQRRFYPDHKGLSEELHLVDRSSNARAPWDLRELLSFSFSWEIE